VWMASHTESTIGTLSARNSTANSTPATDRTTGSARAPRDANAGPS
jgi:hypothetical protein